MTDVITFDVELTENQKMAQHKLYQVHQLYDEIEKLLGAQDIFNKPHLVMVLPNKLKKEPMTNEEWLKTRSNKELANAIFSAFVESATMIGCCVTLERFRTQMELTDALREWLKQPHQKE